MPNTSRLIRVIAPEAMAMHSAYRARRFPENTRTVLLTSISAPIRAMSRPGISQARVWARVALPSRLISMTDASILPNKMPPISVRRILITGVSQVKAMKSPVASVFRSRYKNNARIKSPRQTASTQSM